MHFWSIIHFYHDLSHMNNFKRYSMQVQINISSSRHVKTNAGVSLIFTRPYKNLCIQVLVMCRARAQDRPPARPKPFLLGSSPPEARKPEARTSLTKTPKILCSCMYINTRLPARPKQILHYPNPPEARNLKKSQARVRPKPENLRLAHHQFSSINLLNIKHFIQYI